MGAGNPFAVREKAVYDESFEASADLSGDQYKIVKLHTVAGQVALAGLGEGIGILQNKPALGEAAEVRLLGLSRVVVDGNVDIGDRIKSTASGLAGVAVTANDLALGRLVSGPQGAVDTIMGALLLGPVRDHV